MNRIFSFFKAHLFLLIISICILCFLLFRYNQWGNGIVRTTVKTYVYSKDSINCVTVIQYENILLEFMNEFRGCCKKENMHPGYRIYSGIYFIPGKFKGRLPKTNYIFVENSASTYYIKWLRDTTYLTLPFSHVKENKLDTTKVIFQPDFSKEEKRKYGYYKLKFEDFNNAVSNEYVILRRKEIEEKW